MNDLIWRAAKHPEQRKHNLGYAPSFLELLYRGALLFSLAVRKTQSPPVVRGVVRPLRGQGGD